MIEWCEECGGRVLRSAPHTPGWHLLQRRLLLLAVREFLVHEAACRTAAQYEAASGRVLLLWRVSVAGDAMYCTSQVPGDLIDAVPPVKDDLLALLGEGVREHYAARYGVRPELAEVSYRVFDERIAAGVR